MGLAAGDIAKVQGGEHKFDELEFGSWFQNDFQFSNKTKTRKPFV